jgi:hypothetical protein
MTPDTGTEQLRQTVRTWANARRQQHQENLRLWYLGLLDPTVEDSEEKERVIAELRAACYELEQLLLFLERA